LVHFQDCARRDRRHESIQLQLRKWAEGDRRGLIHGEISEGNPDILSLMNFNSFIEFYFYYVYLKDTWKTLGSMK
jgi:hypothetical protein